MDRILSGEAMATNTTLLLDDFHRDDDRSALGTHWEGFSDRVMGGRSDMAVDYRDSDLGRVLHMQGQVRLDNRGGFIQARLPLDAEGGSFDASAWQGVCIKVRGAPGPYFLHLRTRQNCLRRSLRGGDRGRPARVRHAGEQRHLARRTVTRLSPSVRPLVV